MSSTACVAYRDKLPALAADTAESADTADTAESADSADSADSAVAAHLAGCAACQGELAQWQTVAEAVNLVAATTPGPGPEVLAGVWDRLGPAPTRWRLPVPARRRLPVPGRLRVPARPRVPVPGWLRHAWLLLVGQLPLVRRRLWAASAVVMGLGGVLSLTATTPAAAAGVFSLLAPVIAAVALSLVYGPEVDPGLELALATPTSPRSVLLARMTLVFGYHLALALAANAVITLARGDLGWWWLASQWLGPMLLLASLALLVSVAVGPTVAITLALGLWTLRLATFTEAGRTLADGAVRTAVDAIWSTEAVTLGVTAGLLLAAAAVVGRQRRWA